MKRYFVQYAIDAHARLWWNLGSDDGHDTAEIALANMRTAATRIQAGRVRVADSDGQWYASIYAPSVAK